MKQWLFLLFLLGVACTPPPSPLSPNVVLFLIDDYGYADISFEGNTQIQTPNIDRIAREGVQMTQFYQSSAACAPTRASLLTGRYHLRTGLWGVHWGRDYLRLDEVTLGNAFQDAGYATAAFGKWHSGKSAGYHSWNRGFDLGMETSLYNYYDTKAVVNGRQVHVEGPMTEVVGDQVVRFMEQHQGEPFFCYVPFQAIHEPFNCPEEVFQRYKAQGYTDHVARLYGMIEVLDDNVGKILDALDALQLAENTLVLFMVDDGPSPGRQISYAVRRMNEEEKAERARGWARKLRGSKANIWEGGSISPCYLRWPAQLPANQQRSPITGVIDVLPTLADICGLDLSQHPHPLDGRSFYPVLLDSTATWPPRPYFDNTNFYQIPMDRLDMQRPQMREISVVTDSFKYVRRDRRLSGQDTVLHELYQLDEDPRETRSVAAQYPEATRRLRLEAEQWYEGILQEGRAFPTPVFQLGHPAERSTFINGDALGALSADLRRAGFPIVGWERVGQAVAYHTRVVEAGTFELELLFSPERGGEGAQFMVRTEHDSALLVVGESSPARSARLNLPAGPQTLEVVLHRLSPSGAAIEHLRHLVVHRVPEPGGPFFTKDWGVAFWHDQQPQADTVRENPGSLSFFAQGALPDPLLELPADGQVMIEPFCAEIEQLEKVVVWVDFTPIMSLMPPLKAMTLDHPFVGRQSVNLEFHHASGHVHVSRFDVQAPFEPSSTD